MKIAEQINADLETANRKWKRLSPDIPPDTLPALELGFREAADLYVVRQGVRVVGEVE